MYIYIYIYIKKEKVKTGEAKNSKINKHALFRGKAGLKPFFLLKAKKGKQRKNTKKKAKQKNKEGLGPSEVALWATSPDP